MLLLATLIFAGLITYRLLLLFIVVAVERLLTGDEMCVLQLPFPINCEAFVFVLARYDDSGAGRLDVVTAVTTGIVVVNAFDLEVEFKVRKRSRRLYSSSAIAIAQSMTSLLITLSFDGIALMVCCGARLL